MSLSAYQPQRGGGGGGGGEPDHHHQSQNQFHPQDQQQQQQDDAQKEASSNLKRKCIDYHNPAVLDLSDRLYKKASRSSHVREQISYCGLQPHSSYLRWMGLPIGDVASPVPSSVFLTQMAHVTRAKNSNPVM